MEFAAWAPLLAGLLIGLLLGAVAVWQHSKSRIDAARAAGKNEGEIEVARLTERVESQKKEIARLTTGLSELTDARDLLAAENKRLTAELATRDAELQAERDKSGERTRLLAAEFEELATKILEDKSARFTAKNEANLDLLLTPLREKLQEFKDTVEKVYIEEGKDRKGLATQVQQLMALNQQLSQDAHNLTRALKGSKTQGDFGELLLVRVLEASGLREGHEYTLQERYKREDGSRAQPDAIIHLPEDKHLVVDAKMSSTAYTEYTAAEDDATRDAAADRHLESIRRHVKELSEKNYESLYGLKSLDFVLMFIPLEPAFLLAVSRDSKLWEDAWKRNVLLVSPSTFLFVVKTIDYLWRQEQQNQNVQEIARRGASLYDKLVGFAEDLIAIGEKLNQATSSYDAAIRKLRTGQGNVIWQAEKLKELGVKPSKHLPKQLAPLTLDEEQLALTELDVSDAGDSNGSPQHGKYADPNVELPAPDLSADAKPHEHLP